MWGRAETCALPVTFDAVGSAPARVSSLRPRRLVTGTADRGPPLTSSLVRLKLHLMSSSLQRVNLNLPAAARERLRRLAEAAHEPEATYARELLVEAIDRAERARFRKRLEESRTPQRRARDHQIASAVERLRG